eukprot:m.153386 g.153386  ORF g.153386 m.153386 type:complete len:129 (-) comp16231_c2_seq6:2094-2480(-)
MEIRLAYLSNVSNMTGEFSKHEIHQQLGSVRTCEQQVSCNCVAICETKTSLGVDLQDTHDDGSRHDQLSSGLSMCVKCQPDDEISVDGTIHPVAEASNNCRASEQNLATKLCVADICSTVAPMPTSAI